MKNDETKLMASSQSETKDNNSSKSNEVVEVPAPSQSEIPAIPSDAPCSERKRQYKELEEMQVSIHKFENGIEYLTNEINMLTDSTRRKNASGKYNPGNNSVVTTSSNMLNKSRILFLQNEKQAKNIELQKLKVEYNTFYTKYKLAMKTDLIRLRTLNGAWCKKNKWQIKNRLIILLENERLKNNKEIVLFKNTVNKQEFSDLLKSFLSKNNKELDMYCTNHMHDYIYNEMYTLFMNWDGVSPIC